MKKAQVTSDYRLQHGYSLCCTKSFFSMDVMHSSTSSSRPLQRDMTPSVKKECTNLQLLEPVVLNWEIPNLHG